MKNNKDLGLGMAIGLAIGTAIGVATDNIGAWIAIGVALGAGIGSKMAKKKMIKFFRNIRRKLAEENKVAKYLRYAIGEILLVVIGILIALQVNNWNELQKSKDEEKDILSNIN